VRRLIGTGYMGTCRAMAWNAVASVFGDVPRHLGESAHLIGFEAASPSSGSCKQRRGRMRMAGHRLTCGANSIFHRDNTYLIFIQQ
jgi:hypothetical protein